MLSYSRFHCLSPLLCLSPLACNLMLFSACLQSPLSLSYVNLPTFAWNLVHNVKFTSNSYQVLQKKNCFLSSHAGDWEMFLHSYEVIAHHSLNGVVVLAPSPLKLWHMTFAQPRAKSWNKPCKWLCVSSNKLMKIPWKSLITKAMFILGNKKVCEWQISVIAVTLSILTVYRNVNIANNDGIDICGLVSLRCLIINHCSITSLDPIKGTLF